MHGCLSVQIFLSPFVAEIRGIQVSLLSVRRGMVALSVVAVGFALPVVTAGVANASPQRCQISLINNGYIVGAKVKAACANANASTDVLDIVAETQRTACKGQLILIGVKSNHAVAACYSY